MYNSSFPPLNPNVKYKTALQRAGFDTNLNMENVNENVASPVKTEGSKLFYNFKGNSPSNSPNSTFMDDSSNNITLINKSLQKKQKMLLRKQKQLEVEKDKPKKKDTKLPSPLRTKKTLLPGNNKNLSSTTAETRSLSNKILRKRTTPDTPSTANKIPNRPLESIGNNKSSVTNISELSFTTIDKESGNLSQRDISHISSLESSDVSRSQNAGKPKFVSQDFIQYNLNPDIKEKSQEKQQSAENSLEESFNKEITPPINTLQNIADLQFDQESFYSEIQSHDPRVIPESSKDKALFLKNHTNNNNDELEPLAFDREQHIPPNDLKNDTSNFNFKQQTHNKSRSSILLKSDEDVFFTPVESRVKSNDIDTYNKITTDDSNNGSVDNLEDIIETSETANENNQKINQSMKDSIKGLAFDDKGDISQPLSDGNNELEERNDTLDFNQHEDVEDDTKSLNFDYNSDDVKQTGETKTQNLDSNENYEKGLFNTGELSSNLDTAKSNKKTSLLLDEELMLLKKPYEEKHIPPGQPSSANPSSSEFMSFDDEKSKSYNDSFVFDEKDQKSKEDLYVDDIEDVIKETNSHTSKIVSEELETIKETETIQENKEIEEHKTKLSALELEDREPKSQNDTKDVVDLGKEICRSCHNEILSHEKKIYDKNSELSGKWHKACFSCTVCPRKFSRDEPCYIHKDYPYCENHFFSVTGLLCFSCEEKILDDFCLDVPGLGKAHMGCFRCSDCDLPIEEEYYSNDTINLCGTCVKKTNNSRMEKRRTVIWDAN